MIASLPTEEYENTLLPRHGAKDSLPQIESAVEVPWLSPRLFPVFHKHISLAMLSQQSSFLCQAGLVDEMSRNCGDGTAMSLCNVYFGVQ